MNQQTKEKILWLHSRGVTDHGISVSLRVKEKYVRDVIESEIKKDFDNLF